MTIAVGERLPSFAMQTDGGGHISSEDLKGKTVVLYFYPKDDTPQCTKQALAFRDASADFAAAGITLIGVSADAVASHDRFKAKHGLNFRLASDAEKMLAQAMGVWVEKSMYGRRYMGLERATFLVDGDGVVRRIWRKVKVPGHAAEVLAAAQELEAAS